MAREDKGTSEAQYSIRAVERVCDLLDLVQMSAGPVSLVEAAEATGLPRSSAFRYLWTLEARGYLQRDPHQNGFSIGPALRPARSKQIALVVDRARPVLEALRARFEETINLGNLDGNRVSYLDIAESSRMMRMAARVGDLEPMHCTALGKAIAMMLTPTVIRSILEAEGMPALTPNTITDPDAFVAEIERCRAQGFALDEAENEIGARCVAVPVTGFGIPLAISLSAPAARFPVGDIDEVAAALEEAAAGLLDPE